MQPAVSGVQCPAERAGEGALCPADVEHLRLRAEHDPGDLAVTGEPVQHAPRQRLAGVLQLGRVDAAAVGSREQRLVGDLHDQLRPHARVPAHRARVEHPLAHRDQRVGAALPGRSLVVGVRDTDLGLQSGRHDLGVDRREPAVQQGPLGGATQVQLAPGRGLAVGGVVGVRIDPVGPAADQLAELTDLVSRSVLQEQGLTPLRVAHRVTTQLRAERLPGQHPGLGHRQPAVAQGLSGQRQVLAQGAGQPEVGPGSGVRAGLQPAQPGPRAAGAPRRPGAGGLHGAQQGQPPGLDPVPGLGQRRDLVGLLHEGEVASGRPSRGRPPP